MDICFVSNYINHHQIPLCSALKTLLAQQGGSFAFVQTRRMEAERVQMGWNENDIPDFVLKYYESPEEIQGKIDSCDLVIYGGIDEETYIEKRLREKKPVLRYCERMYKTGQWKAVSPRGLVQKYKDHTSHRKDPVYVLCAGGYVADDFRIVGAYPGKMYCWGYFPEKKTYDVDKLLEGKGYPVENSPEKLPYLLWSGRMIDWKHPELALETAGYLKEQGLRFHLDMVGGGALEEQMKALCREYGLEDVVSFPGFLTPEAVRNSMEKADIYLFTSDRNEGWGAVANESMNSGCAIVIDHMIGAAPFLIRNGENGCLYQSGDKEELFRLTEKLVRDRELRQKLGRQAYMTIADVWNAENAAEKLVGLLGELLEGKNADSQRMTSEKEKDESRMQAAQEPRKSFAPCQKMPKIKERQMYRYLTGEE